MTPPPPPKRRAHLEPIAKDGSGLFCSSQNPAAPWSKHDLLAKRSRPGDFKLPVDGQDGRSCLLLLKKRVDPNHETALDLDNILESTAGRFLREEPVRLFRLAI